MYVFFGDGYAAEEMIINHTVIAFFVIVRYEALVRKKDVGPIPRQWMGTGGELLAPAFETAPICVLSSRERLTAANESLEAALSIDDM